MNIQDLHKLLLNQGHSKVVGISPPDGNQKPLEELIPEEITLHFENASPEEEQAAYDFIYTLDLSLNYLPDVEKLLQLILVDNRLKPSVKSALSDLKDKLAPVVGDKAYVQAFWADFKADSLSFAWLNPKVAAIVETLALECNIPLVDSAPDLSTVADVDSFVATVLSSPEIIPYLIEMSQAMSILSTQIGDVSKIPLMQAFWGSLKVKTSMSAEAVQAVENAAKLYNIPIIDLKS